MVAVLDTVQDYPAQGAWWLGLLLIDPAYRDRGLGHKIYDWFEGWLIEQQVHGVCLGVLEENHAAYRFWQAMGFEEYERQPAQQFSDRVHTVITMIKKL
jgi:ribosomal protein S18 acetylase RimI-like enzyme